MLFINFNEFSLDLDIIFFMTRKMSKKIYLFPHYLTISLIKCLKSGSKKIVI
ncbi:hypothetical protein GLOIN_2v1596978 [Rhizophagus irregularis DAOM 181602=DAOM 197198]|uniref:Uncharacterized protein n=1 Tax=Rhizophagus irregularis (strain DAOM 181602 / DAOM 197198 / MUCL 43194) TaxID=747089 RepID=A0A2P4Q462_RHIID|nr:hypothetical protein GLOIN_2v1596978 [Rhizophagus irregularis DAOM 181602=DAOM 197198]POG72404.1 hypothetical protein GLOIN_2v1596978 [Rhizophagus irregularis DAOM 181602=DAOM 197198]|eukprot:XP_025179270.1 hypothetical protein GLOIN_2v1596978 [Rhizophagus irregularis DAOM 181602=DAOM 197198]